MGRSRLPVIAVLAAMVCSLSPSTAQSFQSGTSTSSNILDSLKHQLLQAPSMAQSFQNGTSTGSNILNSLMHQLLSTNSNSNFSKGLNLDGLMSLMPKRNPSSSNSGQPSAGNALGGLLGKIKQLMNQSGKHHVGSSGQCARDVQYWLSALSRGETWAMKMLDATGKPGKGMLEGNLFFIGDFDECIEISHSVRGNDNDDHVIKGGYCRAIVPAPLPQFLKDEFAKVPFLPMAPTIQWHICLPKSCEDAFSALFENLPIPTSPCVKEKNIRDDPGGIAGLTVFCVFVGVALLCTIYDMCVNMMETFDEKNENKYLSQKGVVNGGFSNDHVTLELKEGSNFKLAATDGKKTERMNGEIEQHVGDLQEVNHSETVPQCTTPNTEKKEGLCRRLLMSFSVWQNARKILDTTAGNDNLGCLNGIRVLSICWVILGHTGIFLVLISDNPPASGALLQTFTMQAVVNGTLSVDSFFLLSGCLVAYLFLRESKKTGGLKCKQMIFYYVHRYWRLTPFYMLLLMIHTCIVKYLYYGPFESPNPDIENCRSNWWINLLYINNVYKNDQICYAVSWFLSLDMQLHIVAPVALIPLAFGWWIVGYVIIGAMVAVHIITYAIYEHQANGSVLLNGQTYMEKVYFMPYCRVAPYAIGLLLGSILYRTKCKLRMKPWQVVLGWVSALAVALTCTYVTYSENRADGVAWSLAERTAHETLFRPGWALMLFWVIFACCHGYGGFVNRILSWKAWTPLARLTFGAYLIHPIIFEYTWMNLRILKHFSVLTMAQEFVNLTVLSFGLALVLSVLLEAPFVALEKIVLKK